MLTVAMMRVVMLSITTSQFSISIIGGLARSYLKVQKDLRVSPQHSSSAIMDLFYFNGRNKLGCLSRTVTSTLEARLGGLSVTSV
jgi:hypothetical protein